MQIGVKENNMIEFKTVAYWNEKFCPSHDSDNTPHCTSCARLQVPVYAVTMYMRLPVDGR